jgi:hypothetical protein
MYFVVLGCLRWLFSFDPLFFFFFLFGCARVECVVATERVFNFGFRNCAWCGFASVRSEGQVKSVASTLVSIDGWLNSQIRAPPMYSFERHQKPLNRAVGKRKDQRASLLDCD